MDHSPLLIYPKNQVILSKKYMILRENYLIYIFLSKKYINQGENQVILSSAHLKGACSTHAFFFYRRRL